MAIETLIFETSGAIARLTFNRPERLNAISRRTIAEANAAMDTIEADPALRVVVLNGTGRAFSAGMDPLWAGMNPLWASIDPLSAGMDTLWAGMDPLCAGMDPL